MPKEVILDSQNTPTKIHEFATQVQWGIDGTVEVATVNLSKEQYTKERGWFVYLDRSAINKLIKTLRRARDQAYGSDE
jgi:hypothetical protein